MRLLLALIGYASTATVIAAVLGVGYLWQADQLNDEKVFRMVALMHGVDLDSVGDTQEEVTQTTPSEQPSIDEVNRMHQLALRDYEVRQNVLQRGSSEFQYLLDRLVAERTRYDDMAQELNERIQQEKDLLQKESVQRVIKVLKSVKAAEGKDLLLKFLPEGANAQARQEGKDQVIRLLNALPADTTQAILKKFKSPEELEVLHELLDEMLDGGAPQRVLDQTLEQLSKRQLEN
ncbi:hypothetical protein [Botrimarina hoheduenensis]|uniref:Uncharacterized protein n=1 Tax=Botrimarina hoheduenensis TaxID=2528000 RepID=A0A5C5VYS3_9BACT|nr:hypothetical protein [Botrimarina hoheduenensis]TWT43185.1 hypothetical protein Pla111_21350 [Botrimarina hoheduenensis]